MRPNDLKLHILRLTDQCRIMEEFRNLRWMPLQPKHLDYENAQFLLIGEGYGDFGKALEPAEEEQGDEKETPREELEKLEDEDGNRIQHLKGKH